MSVKEINPRGALGRLTRSAFHKAKSVPSQSDMDDSARLSVALDELDALKAGNERLRRALLPFAELYLNLDDARCHADMVPPEECARCSKVLAARAALEGK